MVFHILCAGSRVRSSGGSSASYSEMDEKGGLIPLLQRRKDLMIRFKSLRISQTNFPFNTPKWPLRKNLHSHPQMIIFIPRQISARYLPNQWMPVRSSLIESLPLRSDRGTNYHRSRLMTLYCQSEMCMNCFRCHTSSRITRELNGTANGPIYQQVIRRSQ